MLWARASVSPMARWLHLETAIVTSNFHVSELALVVHLSVMLSGNLFVYVCAFPGSQGLSFTGMHVFPGSVFFFRGSELGLPRFMFSRSLRFPFTSLPTIKYFMLRRSSITHWLQDKFMTRMISAQDPSAYKTGWGRDWGRSVSARRMIRAATN